jgi:hypothetical protein
MINPPFWPGASAETKKQELFSRLGRVKTLHIKYDRAGRSTGVALVTYASEASARTAIREYDGANANGQPIHLTLLPSPPPPPPPPPFSAPSTTRARNPFDTVQPPSRSLFDRITGRPSPPPDSGGASARSDRYRYRSSSPDHRARTGDHWLKLPPDNIDRYVPLGSRLSRSPLRPGRYSYNGGSSSSNGGGGGGGGGGGIGRGLEPRRLDRGGRVEPSSFRGGLAGRRGGSGHTVRDSRPMKTREELDAEMDDYWVSSRDAAELGIADTAADAPTQKAAAAASTATAAATANANVNAATTATVNGGAQGFGPGAPSQPSQPPQPATTTAAPVAAAAAADDTDIVMVG